MSHYPPDREFYKNAERAKAAFLKKFGSDWNEPGNADKRDIYFSGWIAASDCFMQMLDENTLDFDGRLNVKFEENKQLKEKLQAAISLLEKSRGFVDRIFNDERAGTHLLEKAEEMTGQIGAFFDREKEQGLSSGNPGANIP